MVELKGPFKLRLLFNPSHFHFLIWLTLIYIQSLGLFLSFRYLIIYFLVSLFRTWWLVGLVSVVSL